MNNGFEMCSLGRYDIPNKQKQSNFKVDLVNSNIAVFGSAMSGKTNFLKLLINCLHKRSNIYNEQIFILDFGGALRDYKDMPLVSAYFDNTSEEYVKRVFVILESILKQNIKDLGSYNFSVGRKNNLPHTTFIIDNLNAFIGENRYSAYHEKFGRICRDGRSRGISVVFTASDTKGISNYLLSFEQKIALNFAPDKCSEIFGSKVESLGNIQGRGYANVTERPDDIIGTFNLNAPYEVQILKCSDINDEDSVFMRKLKEKFAYDESSFEYRKQVQKYKTFPQELLFEDFVNLRQPPDATDRVLSSNNVEVGLDYVEFKPINVDFLDSRVVAIYGKKEFGKTNLLRLLLQNLKNNKKNSRFVFFDDGRKQLKVFYDEFSETFDCDYISEYEQISINFVNGRMKKRKLSPMQQFYKILHEKYMSLYNDYDNDLLYQIYGIDDIDFTVEDLPRGADKADGTPTVFVIQSKSIYLNTKMNSDFIHYFLQELIDVADENDYIFIFTDVKKITDAEVNALFNSTLKTVFLLDNIAEFASERGSKTVFGDMDQKNLKEEYAKCEIGDGYFYNVEADLLKKAKFIKTE